MENNLKLKTFMMVLGLTLVCIASFTDMSNYLYILIPALFTALILTFLPQKPLQKFLSGENLIAIFLIIIGIRAIVLSHNVWQLILGGLGVFGMSAILLKNLFISHPKK